MPRATKDFGSMCVAIESTAPMLPHQGALVNGPTSNIGVIGPTSNVGVIGPTSNIGVIIAQRCDSLQG